MRRGMPNCRQSRLDQYFSQSARPPTANQGAVSSSPSSSSHSLLPQRTVSMNGDDQPTALVDSSRAYATTISSSSSSSSSVSSKGSKGNSTKPRKRSPSGSDSNTKATRVQKSPRAKSPAAAPKRSRSPSASIVSSPTESYHSTRSQPDEVSQQDVSVPQRYTYRPAPHSVFLTPPVTNEKKLADDETLAYGQRSVILPWSTRNVCEGEAGQSCDAWSLLQHILREDVTSSTVELCSLLQALLVHFPMARASRACSFHALAATIDEMLSPTERAHFYRNVLPWMKSTACNGPTVFGTKRVLLLRQGVNDRVVLRHDEVVTLLCCAFFSLFPGRSYRSSTLTRRDQRPFQERRLFSFGISNKVSPINFDSLFSAETSESGRDAHHSKIRCLLQYFIESYHTASDVHSHTVIEVARVSYGRMPDFIKSQAPLLPMEFKRRGLIEDDTYALQADFANKIIGGGVLGRGCVQEEIRFVVSPELLLSRLLCESLSDNEAVFISGCAQFATYVGYASTFRYENAIDPMLVAAPQSTVGTAAEESSSPSPVADAASIHRTTPLRTVPSSTRDRGGLGPGVPMRDICVVTMDAVDFNGYHRRVEDQYYMSWIGRELQKAFVSFRGTSEEYATLPSVREGPIATGNWGCGAFGGDVELKLLIQWCAASEAARPIRYYVFERVDLADLFAPVEAKLLAEHWTVGHVIQALGKYAGYRHKKHSRRKAEGAGTSLNSAAPPLEPALLGILDFFKTVNLSELVADAAGL